MSRDSMKSVGLKTKLKVEKAVVSRKRGISAAAISEKTGIKPATVRLHLLKLKKAGTIYTTKVGRSVIYNATVQPAVTPVAVSP